MGSKKGRAAKARGVRLFVDAPLVAGASLPLSTAHGHYLGAVMRLSPGDTLSIFNGRDGEWRATVAALKGSACTLAPEQKIRGQQASAGPWLLFAPVKSSRTKLLIEKATELGVSKLWPVATEYSQSKRIKPERYRAQAIEAAEQCGRLEVPEVKPLSELTTALKDWPENRRLLFCDEAGGSPLWATLETLGNTPATPWAILIGPEGGFSAKERAEIRSRAFCVPISLGPRILRTETAALAALTLWQAALGDLRSGRPDLTS